MAGCTSRCHPTPNPRATSPTSGSTACLPSRVTLFTGQYPSLHGASQTDGLAKANTDPGMGWLDPDMVPTLGDWFRAGGYKTHYRGKWHLSHADLMIPGTHEGLKTSDVNGKMIAEAVDVYRRADRLDPFGFSGWIGREPHGVDSFAGRPPCQEQWKNVWPQILYDQPADNRYRRSYFHLHRLVDRAIGRVLEALEASGMADDTIVVLTSDHGEMLGAHGGMRQKWHNAFEETVHVPLLVRGPEASRSITSRPTASPDATSAAPSPEQLQNRRSLPRCTS